MSGLELTHGLWYQGDGAFIPLRLACTREARVSDLIGLTCYLYTLEGRQPRLVPPVENYR